MARFDKAALLAAPTLEERVELGRQQNDTRHGAIVPFTEAFDPEIVDCYFRFGSGAAFGAAKREGFQPTRRWLYTDEHGVGIYMALRLDHPDGRKKVLPIRAKSWEGTRTIVEVAAIEKPRPLYNLMELANAPITRPVIVTEGEKSAEAAERVFPDAVSTTWSGGCKAVHLADWRPLIGRRVLIWPDHDKPGWDAAKQLGEILRELGVSGLRVVTTPDTFPDGWDVADPVPEVEHA